MKNEELLRERVAKLEVQIIDLNGKLDDTHNKVEEIQAILLQAKGARWVIVGHAGVAGLASGLVAKFMSLILATVVTTFQNRHQLGVLHECWSVPFSVSFDFSIQT
jgi:hypothetical protein